MTTKEKYEMIDKSKVGEKLLTILQNMEKSSKNFTDESVNSKIDTALDKIIEGFRASKPEALRSITEAKKEVKKEKEKAIKKNEGKDFSDKKDTDNKTGLPKKDTVEERKDIIKKESESEKEAKDRAKKELEKEKEKAKEEIESQIDKLNRLILEDPALQGFNTGTAATGGGKSTPLIDAERKALPRGSRVSKKGWKNQYGASKGGRKYWENRENRSDRKSPDYETGKPYLEKGGNVYSSDDLYEVKMVQDGIELDSKLIRAKNKGEARIIFEDMYEEKYRNEFGDFELEIMLAEPKMADGGYMADGGNVESGSAHIYISLNQDVLKVYHGDDVSINKEDYPLLKRINVKEGFWNQIWKDLREDGSNKTMNKNRGAGHIYIDMNNGNATVYHGDGVRVKSGAKPLYTREGVDESTWDNLWHDLRNEYAKGGYMAGGGGIPYRPYGKTKGRFKLIFKIEGEEQSEIKTSLEEAIDNAKRYASPKLGYTDIHIYDENGKEYFFEEDGYMADGGYMAKGENYEYINNFTRFDSNVPVDDDDFEKFVDAYHKKLSGDRWDEIKYELLKERMGNYLGHETMDKMEAYVEKTHQVHNKMADGGEIELYYVKDSNGYVKNISKSYEDANKFLEKALKYNGKIGYAIVPKDDWENEKVTSANIQRYADGGDIDDETTQRFDKMRSAFELLDVKVKSRIVQAVGIDNAIQFLSGDYSVSPLDLITRAVRNGLLELDEINQDLFWSAIMEAERVTEDYRDSGEGIGSSDITYFTKAMLDDAGYKTGFVNNRLERLDDNGNVLQINKYKMDY